MGFWERTVWFCGGLGRYTRGGFDSAYQSFDHKALDLDLSGRVYLVTGANSGIGKVVARELGARGGTVHMLCRNKAKGDAAAAEMATATGRPASLFIVHQVDLARPQQVKQFASEFCAGHDKLHALVNNAGCMMEERVLTPDGLEAGFACNVLGTYLLTEGLIPVLQKTPAARVVTVTSAGMLTERLDAVDLQSEARSYDGTRAYAKHKRAQVELTHHWAAKYSGIQFLAVHPGWVDTPGVQQSMPSFHSNMKGKLRTPGQGADSVLWCAAANAAMDVRNASFIEDRRPTSEHVTWAGTSAKPGDLEKLVAALDEISAKHPVPVPAAAAAAP